MLSGLSSDVKKVKCNLVKKLKEKNREKNTNIRLRNKTNEMVEAQITIEPLQSLIFQASSCLYDFFHENGFRVSRPDWDNAKNDKYFYSRKGWVYAFYGSGEYPIYVGETGRSLSRRFYEHRNKKWWKHWKGAKVIPCEDAASRILFESLLCLAGGYRKNLKQKYTEKDIFYLSLLGLIELEEIVKKDSPLLADRISSSISVCPSRIKESVEYVLSCC